MKTSMITMLLCCSALAATAETKLVPGYGQVPLSFEANIGQTDSQVKFLARGKGYSLFLTPTEAVLNVSSAVHMKLKGANPVPRVIGLNELPGKAHYLLGTDPRRWLRNVTTFARVKYADVYPGVDLVYYGNQGRLEYDFVVAPGADPSCIQLELEGAEELHRDATGNLEVCLPSGSLTFLKPIVYQERHGARHAIASEYLLPDRNEVAFTVAQYDTSLPLVIDPVLLYLALIGGSGLNEGFDVAVDEGGHAYLTGRTSARNFPTKNPAQGSNGGGMDAFVMKLNTAGTTPVYSTYLGGSMDDSGRGIAVDAAGCAYVVGDTASVNFPTVNALQSNPAGSWDAFLAKLSPDGSSLVYSTYLGGDSEDYGGGVALTTNGNVYVAGSTRSTNFPTASGFQSANAGDMDVFVTALDATGMNVLYSTYLGGSSMDGRFHQVSIAVGNDGIAAVTAETHSPNLPTTPGVVQPSFAGGFGDILVAKLGPAGSNLVYCTYLGGSGEELQDPGGRHIAMDGDGNVYVTALTGSMDFPTTNALQNSPAGGSDAFVAKLDPSGSNLVFSTYLGGSAEDRGCGVAVDADRNVSVVGFTYSTDFPAFDAPQPMSGGSWDAFVTKLDASGSNFVFSSYLGAQSSEFAYSVATDAAGNLYGIGFIEAGRGGGVIAVKIADKLPHDISILSIKAPKTITLSATKPSQTKFVIVAIQNQSLEAEIIPDAATLGNLLQLTVQSVGACPNLTATLHNGPPQAVFPITLASKQKLNVYFEVTFDLDCVNHPEKAAKGDPTNADYSYVATLDHSALDGEADADAHDDICPRSVTPPYEVDPNPDGTIKDKGCGGKKPDKTLGADVFTDVVVKQ